jgi:hypothetical protein
VKNHEIAAGVGRHGAGHNALHFLRYDSDVSFVAAIVDKARYRA